MGKIRRIITNGVHFFWAKKANYINFKYMKCILVFLFFTVALSAQPATKDDINAVLREIQNLTHQIDKRFEQVDKRIDLILWVIGFATTISIAMNSYMMRRIIRNEERQISFESLLLTIKSASTEERKLLRDLLKV